MRGHVRTYDGQDYMQEVWGVAFSLDGKTVASGSEDQTVRIWDAKTGQERLTLTGHDYTVFSVAYSPDGRFLVSSGSDQTVRLWNASNGTLLATLKLNPDQDHGAYSVTFSPDSREIAAACSDGLVLVWDVCDPLQPIALDTAWLTPTVRSLAHAIQQEQAFGRLPVLADALEEAGCTNSDLLTHCRTRSEHIGDCWVVDLLLDKE